MLTLLLLGGTGEARTLAARLDGTVGLTVISSLAGRVNRPALPVGETRTGGFGGVAGMAAWLVTHAPAIVVDATHPFAAGITANAAAACAETSTPLLRLQRPAWPAEPSWHSVSTVANAAEALPSLGARPFLTTGRGGLELFASRPVTALARCVDPPDIELPATWRLILDRGPYVVERETKLMTEHSADVLVTKNSGGELTRAKLVAAAALSLPVVVVERPSTPVGVSQVSTVELAADWVRSRLGARQPGWRRGV